MSLTRKQVIQYAVLPGFIPRINALFMSGFQYIPYLLAIVYNAVKLLPNNHPYTNPQNIGQFGIRHVIATAANNLTFSAKNIDQIILFVTILIGIVIAAIQLILIIMTFMAQPALAAMPSNFAGFFVLDNDQDLSFIMLDMVFGVPDMFNSCIQAAGSCVDAMGIPVRSTVSGVDWHFQREFPFPIHRGLHQLFSLYSVGLLVIAVMITIYFIMTVIAETAQTGTPFGKRYNKVWAPIRIVTAIGLLIPLGVGLNASQYLVLYAAKYGAGFASAGYNLFLDSLATETVGGLNAEQLVAMPNIPKWEPFMQFLFTAKTCQAAVNAAEAAAPSDGKAAKAPVEPYMVRSQGAANAQNIITIGTTYEELVNFANLENQVIIRFGRVNAQDHPNAPGAVGATCGEFAFTLNDSRPVADQEPALRRIQETNYRSFRNLWFTEYEEDFFGLSYPINYAKKNLTSAPGFYETDVELPGPGFKAYLNDFYTDVMETAITSAVTDLQNSARFNVNVNIRNKGWACAACSYNMIADMNGWFVSSIAAVPQATYFPEIMERVYLEKRKETNEINFATRFKPETVGGGSTDLKRNIDNEMAMAMWSAYDYWNDSAATPHDAPTNNILIDSVNALLGTDGVFNMRRNAETHPLAQLSSAGRVLIETSIRNLSMAAIGTGATAVASFFDDFIGQAGSTAAGFLVTVAMVTLTVGFVLFYIIPYLPFIYFFFSFGGWVKGIFEAMVGAPLWALAHIRIDGNGLSGQAALSGYFLILEIFLRPILMVFGLLGSIAIFSAMVKVLNMIFDLVVANFGGFDVSMEYTGSGIGSQVASMRSGIDEFFFTIIYVVIVYMMGMSSFKLIDLVPNNILRWMGQSVATFGDQREDPTQKLVGTSTVGAQQATSAIGGGLGQLTKLASKSA